MKKDPSHCENTTSQSVLYSFLKFACHLVKCTSSAGLPVSRVSEVLLCRAFAMIIILKQIGTFVVLILYSYLTNYCCQ